MKTLLAFTTVALVAATPAMAEKHTFTRDGRSFSYEVVENKGAQVIRGRNLQTGERFVLRLRDNQVSGTYGAIPVSFDVAQAGDLEVATR